MCNKIMRGLITLSVPFSRLKLKVILYLQISEHTFPDVMFSLCTQSGYWYSLIHLTVYPWEIEMVHYIQIVTVTDPSIVYR